MKKVLLSSALLILFWFGGISLADLTITHDTSNMVSYTLNENESFTAWTITISDWTTSITILDRNLWATAAWTWCEDPKNRNACSQWDDAYGYHFQWWNNYGFKWTGDVLSGTDKATWNSGYSNSWFYGTTFIKSTSNPFDYWKDSVTYRWNHYDLWWWSYNDSTYSVDDNSWKINLETVKNRRWPCPEWFHVPSIGELMKVKTMIWNNASEIHSRLLIPYAGWRGNADALVGNLGFYTILWSSSPTSASDPNSRSFYLRDD